MEVPPGYICMDKTEVIRRCEIVINEINLFRKKEDERTILDYIRRKSKRYLSFLPGWKPLTQEEAKENLLLSWSLFPSIASWGTLGEAEDLLNAAHATEIEAMWIAVGTYILNKRFQKPNL